MAASGPANASPRLSVCELQVSAALRWQRRERRSVYGTRHPRVLSPSWIWRLVLTYMPLLYMPRRGLTAYRGGDTEKSDWALTFTWWAHALQPPLKQSLEEAPEPPRSPQEDPVDVLNLLRQLKVPEGLIGVLQNVEWDTLFNMSAAELNVALTEGRELARELMQSEHVQQFLRSLRIDKFEETLESLAEDLGLKEKLPAKLLRERRILEISYVPVFVFARQRLLGRSQDDEEAAQNIALKDPELKAVIKKYEKIPPARSMAKAPNMLEGLYEKILEATTLLKTSRPVAVSLASRVEFLTRDFVDYCQTVFSAVTRYISYVHRFQKNKKALFFFAQHTLPRVLKVLLLLSRLEEILLHRGRVEFAENPRESGAVREKARQLSAVTADLINSLQGIAHGCLAASSPHFQVNFAKALSVYDKGEDPVAAFQAFLEAPTQKSIEGESVRLQRRSGREVVSDMRLRQPQPQAGEQEGSTGTRAAAAPTGQLAERRAHVTERKDGAPPSEGQKHRHISGLEATEYIKMMRAHLDELQGMRRHYTSKVVSGSNMDQALVPSSRVTLSSNTEVLPSTSFPLSPDAGALGGGIPLESFTPFSRQPLHSPLSETNPTAKRTSGSSGLSPDIAADLANATTLHAFAGERTADRKSETLAGSGALLQADDTR